MHNKKILMFGPSFFGYSECIADELRSMGAEVDFYDERPNNGAFCKIMLRYNMKFYYPKVMAYYQEIVLKNKEKQYDFVFVIKSEAINQDVFDMLKAAFPKAKFILYLWDAVDNVPDGKKKIQMYDRVLTFDHTDAEHYGLILRPLFYRKEYEPVLNAKKDYAYDVAFIGTAHSIRPKVVNQVEEICTKEDRKLYKFLFLPHIVVFIYNKLLNPAYRNVKKSDIHFTSMSASEIREVYDSSRCILDVEHVAQRGLTMRTIEMIGIGKKLITTNTGIMKYDFYNPQNICVIDRNEVKISKEFWNGEYEPIPQETLKRYSLRSFVCEIFDVKE